LSHNGASDAQASVYLWVGVPTDHRKYNFIQGLFSVNTMGNNTRIDSWLEVQVSCSTEYTL